MKKQQVSNRFKDVNKEQLLIELKCFLKKPTESNLEILFNDMVELVQGPKEAEYISVAPEIEKAQTLEDLFK